MAVEATLERDTTSISLPLVGEGAGVPLVAVDHGKPESGPASKGIINPRWGDFWSQLESYTLNVRFTGSDAYSDAIALADLIKSHSGGEDLVLDIPGLPEIDTDVVVAPAPEQDSAVSFTYNPGGREMVDAQVSLTRVNETAGTGSQQASTPTASGSGPITLSDGSDTVSFTAGITVERSVGRPNSVIRRSTQSYPNYVDHRKAAYEAFELSAEFVDSSAVSDVEDLAGMVGKQLGRDSLTLDFNGLYGLGSFAVVPQGSQALRRVRPSAEQGTIIVPKLSLRRVKS